MGLALDEPRENEDTVHANGIDVLIGEEAIPFVSEKKIDYIKSARGEGFTITSRTGGSCC